MTFFTALKRGDDGPDPVGLFDTFEEAEAYAAWAQDEEECEYEVVAIASQSPAYVIRPPEPRPIVCPVCGRNEFETRGTRRTYHRLGLDLRELDGWEEGDIEMDYNNEDGENIIYCVACQSEFTADELRGAEVNSNV
jgi:hypothetical protein